MPNLALTGIPPELQEKIAFLLGPPDLKTLRLVSRSLRQAAERPFLICLRTIVITLDHFGLKQLYRASRNGAVGPHVQTVVIRLAVYAKEILQAITNDDDYNSYALGLLQQSELLEDYGDDMAMGFEQGFLLTTLLRELPSCHQVLIKEPEFPFQTSGQSHFGRHLIPLPLPGDQFGDKNIISAELDRLVLYTWSAICKANLSRITTFGVSSAGNDGSPGPYDMRPLLLEKLQECPGSDRVMSRLESIALTTSIGHPGLPWSTNLHINNWNAYVDFLAAVPNIRYLDLTVAWLYRPLTVRMALMPHLDTLKLKVQEIGHIVNLGMLLLDHNQTLRHLVITGYTSHKSRSSTANPFGRELSCCEALLMMMVRGHVPLDSLEISNIQVGENVISRHQGKNETVTAMLESCELEIKQWKLPGRKPEDSSSTLLPLSSNLEKCMVM